MDIYIALVHHPVRNRLGEEVTTSVTNLDIHDLARAARTYGVRGTFIVTPIEPQGSLVSRIIGHWTEGEGSRFNPIRAQAFEGLHVAADLEEASRIVDAEVGTRPQWVATGANLDTDIIDYAALRRRILDEEGPLLLLFGTGWGLIDEVLGRCDLRLPAVRALPGRDGYNHLSVRSAASIILDRLLGAR
ncbi:MAG: RNA methyltransferase [Myxococcota bacterium]